MRSGSTFRIRATRDNKSCLFKILVIVKVQFKINNNINRFVLKSSDWRAAALQIIQKRKFKGPDK